MSITTLSSRQFNQDTGQAKKAAKAGPVVITDRGQPSHVLLTFDEYKKLSQKHVSLAQALAMPGGEDIEFDPPRSRELPRAAELD
jgi:prevent-host-death family protein